MPGSIAVIVALFLLPRWRPTVNAIGVTLATPGTPSTAGRQRGGNALLFAAALRVLDDQVAGERAADRVVDRRLQAVGEHRDEGDEREPDGQRRGSHHRAAGLAHRVLLRQAAGDPAPGDERADRVRKRGHDAIARGLVAAAHAHDQPNASQDHERDDDAEHGAVIDARDDHDDHEICGEPDQQAAPGDDAGWDLDALAHRRERRHARRAQRRRRPASTVTTMPTSSETTIVRVSSTVPLSGRSAPNALNS